MGKPRKKRVSFWATRKVSKPVRVSFETRDGDVVSFRAVRKVSRPVGVSFYAKRKKRR